jgi:hypothetical protein
VGGSVGSIGSVGSGSVAVAARRRRRPAWWRRQLGALFDGNFWKTRGHLSTCKGTVYHYHQKKKKRKKMDRNLVVSCGLQLTDTFFFLIKKKKQK